MVFILLSRSSIPHNLPKDLSLPNCFSAVSHEPPPALDRVQGTKFIVATSMNVKNDLSVISNLRASEKMFE